MTKSPRRTAAVLRNGRCGRVIPMHGHHTRTTRPGDNSIRTVIASIGRRHSVSSCRQSNRDSRQRLSRPLFLDQFVIGVDPKPSKLTIRSCLSDLNVSNQKL
jgi:hypothetical protein